MIFEHQSKNKKVLLAIFAVLLVAGVSYIAWPKLPNNLEPIFCTQEVKLCPDGSYAGRTGPKCEFAACPGENSDLWKTTTSNGITFQYPETLPTTYTNTQTGRRRFGF